MGRRVVIRKPKNDKLNCLLPGEQEVGKSVAFHRLSAFRDPLTMSFDEITNEAQQLANIQEKLRLEGGSAEYAGILDRLNLLKKALELKRRSEL